MTEILRKIEHVAEEVIEEVESVFTHKEQNMPTITTSDLIETMWSNHGHSFNSKNDVRDFINAFFGEISEHLDDGDRVRLENLGVLHVVSKTQSDMLFGQPNPNAGQITRQVTFRDTASLRRKLNS